MNFANINEINWEGRDEKEMERRPWAGVSCGEGAFLRSLMDRTVSSGVPSKRAAACAC